MIKYNVHIYREMRLRFEKIEAETPEAAASIAHVKPSGDADDIEDCNGDDLSALVDVAGDEDYRHSVTIDFESERQRKAAPKLLASLERSEFLMRRVADGDHRALENLRDAADQAAAAIAEANAAGIPPLPPIAKPPTEFAFTHEAEETPDRAFVLVDGRFDVAIIRTDEGIVVDVYPKDGIDTIASTYAFDSDAETIKPEEA